MSPFIDDENQTSGVGAAPPPQPLAVVGMSFRGPGDATSVEGLWKMIVEHREGRMEVPKDRWNPDALVTDIHPDSAVRQRTDCLCL
jgi:acyl transferase domain-containing protein